MKSKQKYDSYPTGRCEHCGKFAFKSRKHAKQYMQRELNSKGMSTYRCYYEPNYWHFGHTPTAVRHGAQVRGARAKERKNNAELA